METNKIIISGTGCALADYLYTGVRFNSEQFQKYRSKHTGDGGLSPGKLVFTEEIEKFSATPYPVIIKELSGNRDPDAFNIGGPGLVSLINVSQLLDCEDFEVKFFGGSGMDKTAGLIHDLARKTPLNISNYTKISSKASPFTDVLSDATYDNNQGERTFINNIGAAWDFSPDLLGNEFFNADIVCFGGTALVPQIHDSLSSLLEKAKKSDCLTVVNTVYDFRYEKKYPDKPWPLCTSRDSYKLIDLLLMDCEEAVRISGSQTIEEAAEFFIDRNVASFIITNGAKEMHAFSNGRVFQRKELCKLPVSMKVSEDLNKEHDIKGDTTGCGDNFAGGAIASLALQLKTSSPGKFDFDELLAWAVASGGFACFYLGGTYFEEVPGEKLSKVEAYKSEYRKQISNL
ncbi:carbohydrate kinase family protein [Bacteroidota bacterium]